MSRVVTNSRTKTKGGLILPPARADSARQLVEGGGRGGMQPATQACSLCADELLALELPYRIMLRCTHGEN